MFETRIKVSPALYERLEKVAAHQGYASVQELAIHVLETVAKCADNELSEEEVRKRLQGLGYLG